jgi:tocopherol cyclase
MYASRLPNFQIFSHSPHSFLCFYRAWEHSQGLGCTFTYQSNSTVDRTYTTALSPQSWRDNVETGFQMLPTSLQGRIDGHDGTLDGILDGIPGTCSWDISITPKCGWGDIHQKQQKSTAGWLAKYPVFEPHWQVTLADATASGVVTWKNQTFYFQDEPFYAEKNWGGENWMMLVCSKYIYIYIYYIYIYICQLIVTIFFLSLLFSP